MDNGLIVRTAVLVYALINNILVMLGLNVLPFANTDVEIVFAGALTVGASLWAWYKNNSITKEAKQADSYMHDLKARRKSND